MNETSLMKACRGGDVTTAKALLKARKCDLLTKNKVENLTCRVGGELMLF